MANMASPYRDGSRNADVLSSRDIDILRERIHLQIGKSMDTATYTIEYHIRTDVTGRQIPLLFYAVGYKSDFKVWIDDREAIPEAVPGDLKQVQRTPFASFLNYFSAGDVPGTTTLAWGPHDETQCALKDLQYFEADLSKGEHTIRVQYTADAHIYYAGWVTEYNFRYSLSPAKHWRSFGMLELTVDAEEASVDNARSVVDANVGAPYTANRDVQHWQFDHLPGDYLNIKVSPAIAPLPRLLIAIDPFWLMVLTGAVALALHLWTMKIYRKRRPGKQFSPVLAGGSIVLPLLVLLSYPGWYELIDRLIGPDAGRRGHGYSFLIVFFYPVVMPVYWLLMWPVDRAFKRNVTFRSFLRRSSR